jgi:hypothetical protein
MLLAPVVHEYGRAAGMYAFTVRTFELLASNVGLTLAATDVPQCLHRASCSCIVAYECPLATDTLVCATT